jgi:hypothetical protein
MRESKACWTLSCDAEELKYLNFVACQSIKLEQNADRVHKRILVFCNPWKLAGLKSVSSGFVKDAAKKVFGVINDCIEVVNGFLLPSSVSDEACVFKRAKDSDMMWHADLQLGGIGLIYWDYDSVLFSQLLSFVVTNLRQLFPSDFVSRTRRLVFFTVTRAESWVLEC